VDLGACAEAAIRRAKMKEASGSPEVSMDSAATQLSSEGPSGAACTHSRLIDNVLTRAGKWTGKVVCRECGARFDDPYGGLK
jgi:hypothetical protein